MGDNFNDLLLAYTERLKVKNYSPATRSCYISELRPFIEYLSDKGVADIRRVTAAMLKDYQLKIAGQTSDRTNRMYTVSTLCMKTRAVKRFFEYLEDSGRLLINPAENIKEPKKETRLPRVVLTGEEVKKVLDQPNLSTMTGIRDRALIEVLYSTGIRREELIRLTIYDCDLQGGTVRVNKGKFSKDRIVPLGKHAVKFLREYLTHVRPHLTKKDKTLRQLFVSKMGTPLSSQMAEIMVRNYAKKAGIKKRVTPHVFRHTFATELVRNGADITAVRKMLGHADLSATSIYIKVAGVDVKKTHSQSHPRERDKEEDITPHIRCKKESKSS